MSGSSYQAPGLNSNTQEHSSRYIKSTSMTSICNVQMVNVLVIAFELLKFSYMLQETWYSSWCENGEVGKV